MSTVRRTLRTSALVLAMLSTRTLPAHAGWPTDPTVNLPIVVTEGNQSPMTSAADGLGGIYVAWMDLRATALPGADVYVTRLRSDGALDPAWPANGLPVGVDARSKFFGPLLADPAGGVLVGWSASNSGTYAVMVQHVLADGRLDPAWPSGGRTVCTATTDFTVPILASDGAGGVLVTWDGLSEGVYSQHVRADGTLDPAWPAVGRRASPYRGYSQYLCSCVSDGSGGLLVGWMEYNYLHDPFAEMGEFDLLAHHVRADGTLDPSWPGEGLTVADADGDELCQAMRSDGSGGFLALWTHTNLDRTSDLYAQHVLASGIADPAWPLGGRAVCVAADSPSDARFTTDGAGGVLVAWCDRRNGTSDVYAAHLGPAGTLDPAWPVNGLAVCTAPGEQWFPHLVTDLAGGAIVQWQDARGGETDIYAQRVLASGAVDPAWPADGRGLCTAVGTQAYASLAPDGAGGAVALWCDTRSYATTKDDVYAMRVQRNGTLGGDVAGVDPRLASALALAPPRPHPARGGPLTLAFTLPRAGDATLELFDLAGRRLDARALRGLAAGPHEARLGDASLRPGLHLVCLRHGDETRTLKVLVLE